MQDGARSHTAKLLFAMGSPDLNPVNYCVWGILERNVYHGRKITEIDMLKAAIVGTRWDEIPQDVINCCLTKL